MPNACSRSTGLTALPWVGGAEAALVVGWARPAPWLLALLLVAILPLPWLFAVSRCVRADRASR
jgi:hypothetical protein